MQIQKYTFRKTIGGLSIMASVLLLLIGFTQYNQLFSSAKYDFIKGVKYAKTALQTSPTKQKSMKKFNLTGNGEIMLVHETDEGKIIRHYRAIYSPELVNNYEVLPQLYLEIIKDKEKKWIREDIYKIDREKGLIYFLFKLENNHQILLTNTYTGNYKINLIK